MIRLLVSGLLMVVLLMMLTLLLRGWARLKVRVIHDWRGVQRRCAVRRRNIRRPMVRRRVSVSVSHWGCVSHWRRCVVRESGRRGPLVRSLRMRSHLLLRVEGRREGGIGGLRLRRIVRHPHRWRRVSVRRVGVSSVMNRRVRDPSALRWLNRGRFEDVVGSSALGRRLLLDLPRLARVLPSDVLPLGLQSSAAAGERSANASSEEKDHQLTHRRTRPRPTPWQGSSRRS